MSGRIPKDLTIWAANTSNFRPWWSKVKLGRQRFELKFRNGTKLFDGHCCFMLSGSASLPLH